MSDYVVKQKEAISLLRKYVLNINNSTDNWQPLMEAIFFIKTQRTVDIKFYLVNSDLQPREYSPGAACAVLGLNVTLQQPGAAGPTPLFSQDLKLAQNSALMTLQVSSNRQLSPGFYVLVVQVNLRGSQWSMAADMTFLAQKAYLAVAGV